MRYEAEYMKTGKKVRVYWNLHKKCFSVISLEKEKKGLVVAHVNQLNLDSPVFKVSEKGRQRVLREKKKNVHAFGRGDLNSFHKTQTWDQMREVKYNPYKMDSFYYVDTGEPVKYADKVLIQYGKVWAC